MINQMNIVVDSDTDNVEGYTNISIENISQITNGYVNNIVFNTIDKVNQKDRDAIFIELCKKLSRGGSLTIRFLNPESLASKIKNGNFAGSNFSGLVSNLNSAWMETDFLGLVSSIQGFGLSKHIHEDVYSIVVIEKNK